MTTLGGITAKTSKSTTLIVEPSADGHRLYYVHLLIEGATARGRRVVLLTTEKAVHSQEYYEYLAQWRASIEVITQRDFTVRAIEGISRDFGAETTVVPDGDIFTFRLAMSRGWKGAGRLSTLIMREDVPASAVPGLAAVKAIAKGLLIRRANTMDNVTATVLKSALWRGSNSIPAVADPVSMDVDPTTLSEVREHMVETGCNYWFAVVGVISQRKNPVLVLDALAAVTEQKLGLILAGRIDEEILDAVERAAQRARESGQTVIVLNRLLSSKELDSIVSFVDCVVLAHSNEGPSGILGKAAVMGTRVIGAGARSLQKDADFCGDLMSWQPLDESRLAAAMRAASTADEPPIARKLDSAAFAAALL